ncbi:hypothetical protein ABC895_11530, partial [Capnocytophaga sputigena]|uniref:hypothetical protein n=1 Tax=Capnocytophaga sputigena TaxID=1019 RepID=UPI0031F4AEC8
RAITKSLPNLLVIPVSSLFKIDYKSSFNFGAKTTAVHLPAQRWFFIALTFLMSKLANCQLLIKQIG